MILYKSIAFVKDYYREIRNRAKPSSIYGI